MLLTVTLTSVFILGGCDGRAGDNNVIPDKTNDQNQTNGNRITGTFDSNKVNALEEAIEKIEDVANADVILSSDTAWIAVTLNGDSTMGTTPGGTGTDTVDLVTPNEPNNAGPAGTAGSTTNITDDSNMTNGVTNGDTVNIPENLRKEITDITKEMYPEITTVHITADPTLVRRIQEIARDLAAGTERTLEDFADDLMDIGNRITG